VVARALGVGCLVGCARVPTTLVVEPIEAAKLSARYHDRVIVMELRRKGEPADRMTGVVAHEGGLVVTADRREIATRPSDDLLVKIQYVDGDPFLLGGVVHKGPSTGEVAAGSALIAVGVAAATAFVAEGIHECHSVDESFVDTGILCGMGYGWLTLTAAAATVIGVGFVVRGRSPVTLSVTPAAQGGAARLTLSF